MADIVKQYGQDGLPWWLEYPGEIPAVYLHSDNYLVLDFETTTLSFGSATNPMNRLVCAAWYTAGDSRVQYQRGGEFEQLKLLADIATIIAHDGVIVAHNAKFEILWLIRMGVDPSRIFCYDTMIGEHIIRGNRNQMKVNLNDTAQRYGCTSKAYTVDTMLKCGICTTEMPEELVKARVIKDVKDTTTTFLKQRKKLKEDGQLALQGTRCIFTPVLAAMEMEGIQLLPDMVKQEYDEINQKYDAAVREWNGLYPGTNPRSTPDMARLVYDTLGFEELTQRGRKLRNKPSKQFPNGVPKVDNGTLSKLPVTTEEQTKFIQIREDIGNLSAKLTKTLGFMKGICEEHGGKFHGQFNQHIAATHRLSSSSVQVEFEDGKKRGIQLQNLPRIYKPMVCAKEDGNLVGEVDGSQLEFRVAAFLGQDKQAISDIRNDIDRHVQTAMQLYGYSEEEWAGLAVEDKKVVRQTAKAETFKPLYGGKKGTENQMRYYEWFRRQFPDLATTQEGWTYEVLATGEIQMPWGMKWYFPGTNQNQRDGYISNTPSIYNYPVQNLATGEMIPIAVTYQWHRNRLLDKDIKMFNTVHDSSISEFPPESEETFREVAIQAFTMDVYEYLEQAYSMDFNVPLGVGITVGSSWASKDSTEYEINVERSGEYWVKGSK